MARSANASRPGRALLALVALLAVIFGSIALGATTSDGQWTPKLALDLDGGTQLILSPKPAAGEAGKITAKQITDAVKIIRQRVNGTGVSEAEVTTEGSGTSQSIVVSLPGTPDKKTLDLVKKSAELMFRPVLVAADAAPAPTATVTPTPSGTATPKATSTSKAKSTSKATPKASATNGRIVPQALTKAAATKPATAAASDPSAAASDPSAAAVDPSAAAVDPNAAPADPNAAASAGTASDLAQITEALGNQFTKEDCSDLDALQSAPQDPSKPIVTCESDGTVKYILGPAEVRGTNIKSATAGMGTTSQGASNGQWLVDLNFDGPGTKAFAKVTERLAGLTGAQNQFAIVLDQLVISAPTTNERIPGGTAQISGSFTQASATALADQLKFGALPVTFQVDTQNDVSALLGGEQLERGLLAGLIGLILVVIYSLLQYRALGLVTVFSLLIAGAFTYGLVVLLGTTQGFRLSLSGVAGLIVAIGITADSFIVYFERVRDEVREGRPLRSAVEAAWVRARRTILISDAVSFLAAVVLYVLAVGGVRGFAFTLGLTTLIDVLVVFLFTKPAVTLLSRTHFFGGGHRLSGFAPEQLGRTAPAYAGRGRVRTPADQDDAGLARQEASTGSVRGGQSIAARRAARLAEEERGTDPTDDDPGGGSGTDRVSAGRSTKTRKDV
ncbi:MAG TPA: protein translocase subunit SecD [Kineosporiaceae bacterium]|nr:protein translocase subunit SecD [Kineosporiaceae bacterium]